MKKLLLVSTALVGVAALAAPAHAELKMDLGGHFAGYYVNSDNDTANLRENDLRRDSEFYVTGESTLDNGTTVGFHTEQKLGSEHTMTDEVYAYFSGGWGRVNVGSEDGAAYLLQVAAPSADSNIDGLRTYIQALAPSGSQTSFVRVAGNGAGTADLIGLDLTTLDANFGGGNAVLDYDHVSDNTANAADRLTYLTPKFNGFQGGVSWAPEQGQNAPYGGVAVPTADNNAAGIIVAGAGGAGAGLTGGPAQYEDIWEAAVRWDGEFSGVGIAAGVGYSQADLEGTTPVVAAAAGSNGDIALDDGNETWNAGLNFSYAGFTLGGSYLHTEQGVAASIEDNGTAIAVVGGDVERDTWVAGLGYDNGPWHVGGTYLHQETQTPTFNNLAAAVAANDVYFVGASNEVERFTVGGGYTFGPGVTFRGSVAWGEFETGANAGTLAAPTGATNDDFTQIAVGTDIQF